MVGHHAAWRKWLVGVALGAVGLGAVPAWAQAEPHRVAVLTAGGIFTPVLDGLRDGLRQLGYVEGKDLTLIVDDTHGTPPDLAERAARLVAARPHVLVALPASHTVVAKRATATVPIVFALVSDPVGFGLVASYASSKNNLTGVLNPTLPTAPKRLQLLRELAPGTRRILAIVAPGEAVARAMIDVVDDAAKRLGVEVVRRDVASKEDIERVLRETPPGSVDAIYHVASALVGTHIGLLIKKSKDDRIPLIVHEDSMVEKGALASYGAEFRLMGTQSATLVAKILKGTKPADIPIETPRRLLLAINLSTAKTIGLKIPRAVSERADRLLE